MASPASRRSADGTDSPDLPDNIMVDGQNLPQLSIPSPPLNTADQKTTDWNLNWDVLSPTSSTSASSIGSPLPSSAHLTRSKSKAMKPRKNQSAYFDEESGRWKCRNCGGNYDVPNPGSRQRRDHKKACEESLRVKALQRAQAAELVNKNQAVDARLREKGFGAASNDQNVPGKSTNHLLQNGHAQPNITDDLGALNTTPDIPEIEEVNFGAPTELIHSGETQAQENNAAGQLNEPQKADAKPQSENLDDQKTRPGQDGAQLYEKEQGSEETGLPSEQDHPVEAHGFGDAPGTPLQIEPSKDVKLSNDSSRFGEDVSPKGGPDPSEQDHQVEAHGFGDAPGTPSQIESSKDVKLSNDSSRFGEEVSPRGGPDHQEDDKTSPPRKTKLLDEFEHVKYCSTPTSEEGHLAGTLYHQLVDLHDEDAQAPLVTRSVSLGPGLDEAARITSLKHETIEALGKHFGRTVSVDHFGIDVATGKDHHHSRVSRLGGGAVATTRKEHSRDASPDHLVQALVGKELSSKASIRNNDTSASPQSRRKASARSIGDGKITNPPTPGPAAVSRRAQSYRPRALATPIEQSGSRAVASCSKQPQPHSLLKSQSQSQPRGHRAGASSRRQSDGCSESRKEDDNFGAMVVRNVGKFWMHIASVGAVAVIAWVGKSLAEGQQSTPQRRAPEIRRGHFTMNSISWDD